MDTDASQSLADLIDNALNLRITTQIFERIQPTNPSNQTTEPINQKPNQPTPQQTAQPINQPTNPTMGR